MVLLDRLQRLNAVRRNLSEEAIRPEVTNPGRDQLLRFTFDFLHGTTQVVVCVDHISIGSMQDLEFTRGNLYGINLSTIMDKQMVITRCAMRDQRPPERARQAA